MTKNQIDYLNYLENVRAHQASEGLTQQTLDETKRSNQVREKETFRHNYVGEQISDYGAREQARHNLVGENLTFQNYLETQRSNLARETETHRSNVAQETETHRSNAAREEETHRSNVAREIETRRSNQANESIGWANVKVAQSNAAANMIQANASALNAQTRVAELEHKKDYDASYLRENKRHNIETEVLQSYSNTTARYDAETRRQQANEAKRHNMKMETTESLKAQSQYLGVYNDLIDAIIPF